MKSNVHTNGTRIGMVSGTATGVGLILAVCLILSAISAWLTVSETISESMIGPVSTAILFMATIAGALVSCILIRKQYAIVCGAVAGVTILLTVCVNILFWNSEFHAVLEKILAILMGSAGGCMLCLKKTKSKRGKFKKRFR